MQKKSFFLSEGTCFEALSCLNFFLFLASFYFFMKRKRKKILEDNSTFEGRVDEERFTEHSKTKNPTNYCCSFRHLFHPLLSEDKRILFQKEVDKLVLALARLRHEVSYLANYILLRECEKDTWDIFLANEAAWIEFYRSCMAVILKKKVGSIMSKKFCSTETTARSPKSKIG